ncbi:MAG: UpxY family transcription antiterminator [Bryobacteraceae bacterium]
MFSDRNQGDWYAFRVRPRHEKTASAQLKEKGYTEFLPLIREQRKWGSRRAIVDAPLFPGYIFCQAQRSTLYPILNLPAVVDVVRAGSQPLPAAREEVDALKRAIDASLLMEPWSYTEVGQPVCITSGPLAGLTGIVVEVRQAQRLVLSVSLLRRSVLVEVDRDSIAKTGTATGLLAYRQAAGAPR